MGLRLVARPAGEARPALRAVGAHRAARVEEVLDDRAGAVGEVVGAVAQRDRHPVGAPGPAAVEAPAEELEGAEVDVVVEEAAHLGRRARALERRAGDVDLDLGELRAALRGDEAPARAGGGDLDEPAEAVDAELLAGGDADQLQLAATSAHAPVGRRPGRAGGGDRVEQRVAGIGRRGRRAGSARARWPACGTASRRRPSPRWPSSRPRRGRRSGWRRVAQGVAAVRRRSRCRRRWRRRARESRRTRAPRSAGGPPLLIRRLFPICGET